ncbi:MAG: SGNH/GDSL hydrolase family protein [Isosphaeraceae bacterium]
MIETARQRAVLVILLTIPTAGAQPDQDQVHVITRPERSLADIDRAHAEMSPVSYKPPADRWDRLPRTARILASSSGELRVLMLGDSIVNDTSRSGWDQVLQRSYPNIRIIKTTCVRGSTGCWWFKSPDRIERYVLANRPDLLILGGISHRDDLGSVAELIEAVRARLACDVLIMTPAFGTVDPRDDRQWRLEVDPSGADFRSRLVRLANDRKLALLDMTAEWGRFIRASGKSLEWFKRDVVHANARGEQILGRILAAHLMPPLPPSHP